jgi:protocatechuate 3,4-dioxygenase alpha subunit
LSGRSATDKAGVFAFDTIKPVNATDPILALVPSDRRGTLIAHKQGGGDPAFYRFDIRVQGDNETVFFDI